MLLMPDPSSPGWIRFARKTRWSYLRRGRAVPARATNAIRARWPGAQKAYLKIQRAGAIPPTSVRNPSSSSSTVTWSVDMSAASSRSVRGSAVVTGIDYDAGNLAHRPPVKGGYFPVPRPIRCRTSARDLPAARAAGVEVEVHHHEVAAPGQNEIGTKFASLVRRADGCRSEVHDLERGGFYGKTATFMPKPVVGDNGSGMHVHQSVWKDGQNLFAATATPAFPSLRCTTSADHQARARAERDHNPGTNSYKRLVPGFEAPINLAYSARNRSAACRIPYVSNPKGRRVEVRFPDPTTNPYLGFAAMLGRPGRVQNKIHPGDPVDKNLYDPGTGRGGQGRLCVTAWTRRSASWTRTASF